AGATPPPTAREPPGRGGVLQNRELCVGRWAGTGRGWGRAPDRGGPRPNPTPPHEWLTTEVPELRIIDEALWRDVKARQSALELDERGAKIRNALNTRHRARHLLSGLLTCGVCGAGFTGVGNDRYACANHLNRGTCSNRRT